MDVGRNIDSIFTELDKWVSDKGTGGYIEYEYNPYICIKENFLNEELGIQQVREELLKLSYVLDLNNLTNGTCLEIGLGFFGSTHFLWRLLFDEVITIEKNFERVREFGRNTKKYYNKFILDDKRSKFYNGLSNDENISFDNTSYSDYKMRRKAEVLKHKKKDTGGFTKKQHFAHKNATFSHSNKTFQIKQKFLYENNTF